MEMNFEELRKLAKKTEDFKRRKELVVATQLELFSIDLQDLIKDVMDEKVSISGCTMEDLIKMYLEFGTFNPQ
jgi:hypothetical protein